MRYQIDFLKSALEQLRVLLNKPRTRTKTLLRQMRRTVEDIEDARTMERAKRANGSKARIPWAEVKKELRLA